MTTESSPFSPITTASRRAPGTVYNGQEGGAIRAEYDYRRRELLKLVVGQITQREVFWHSCRGLMTNMGLSWSDSSMDQITRTLQNVNFTPINRDHGMIPIQVNGRRRFRTISSQSFMDSQVIFPFADSELLGKHIEETVDTLLELAEIDPVYGLIAYSLNGTNINHDRTVLHPMGSLVTPIRATPYGREPMDGTCIQTVLLTFGPGSSAKGIPRLNFMPSSWIKVLWTEEALAQIQEFGSERAAINKELDRQNQFAIQYPFSGGAWGQKS